VIRSASIAATALSASVVLVGCGADGPRYEEQRACGIPTARVTAVVGDNHYEVVQSGSDTLPLGPGTDSANGLTCTIERDGDTLVEFSARRTSADDLKQRSENAESADEHYAHAGGTLGFSAEKDTTDDGYNYEGWWVCDTTSPDGTQVASATASSAVQAKNREFQALLEAVATAAGCG
jgi:hypothetical protein